MFGGSLIASRARLPFASSVVVLNRQLWRRLSPSSTLALSLSLPAEALRDDG
jgi:hypothetical protein